MQFNDFFFDNTSNGPSKFRAKTWVELDDDSHVKLYSQSQCETSVLKSISCDCNDRYVRLNNGTTTISNTGTAATPNSRNKKGIFKNCALFTNCISDINNTQVHNFKDIDVAMLMHNIR